MKKITRVQQADTAPFNLTWILSDYTNTEGTLRTDWDSTEKFMKELQRRYSNIRCSIADNHADANSFLPKIVDEFYANGHCVSLSTNGNTESNLWKDIAHKFIWIGFNYHPEHSSRSYFDNLNVAKHLTRCGAKIAMLPSQWDHCMKVYLRLCQDDKHETDIDRISNIYTEYTEEQLEWFNMLKHETVDKTRHIVSRKFPNAGVLLHFEDGTVDNSYEVPWFINNELTNFKGYTCEIGLKSLCIDPSGNIRRGLCSQGGYIGNLDDVDNIRWPTDPVICQYELCLSATDVKINKWINK